MNGPSCTTSHKATLHNFPLRINSAQKVSIFSGNALFEILRKGPRLQNCSNTNGSLQSSHRCPLIQEPRAIVAHQATQIQEAALVELSFKVFICSSGAGSSVGNCFLMVPMKDD